VLNSTDGIDIELSFKQTVKLVGAIGSPTKGSQVITPQPTIVTDTLMLLSAQGDGWFMV
jgi:hypothetical protein